MDFNFSKKRNFAEHDLKYAKRLTRANFEDQRTAFYEAESFARQNPNNPNAKAKLKRETEKLEALGAIVYDESQKRKIGRNTTMGTTIAKKTARGDSNAAKFRPKSPSPSSLPRSAAGVKTTSKTVNKLYRPMGK